MQTCKSRKPSGKAKHEVQSAMHTAEGVSEMQRKRKRILEREVASLNANAECNLRNANPVVSKGHGRGSEVGTRS